MTSFLPEQAYGGIFRKLLHIIVLVYCTCLYLLEDLIGDDS